MDDQPELTRGGHRVARGVVDAVGDQDDRLGAWQAAARSARVSDVAPPAGFSPDRSPGRSRGVAPSANATRCTRKSRPSVPSQASTRARARSSREAPLSSSAAAIDADVSTRTTTLRLGTSSRSRLRNRYEITSRIRPLKQ
ncbi:MAG TPA: hypothetical protein VF590_02495 [Isosphaeraceae bacterium]